MGNPKALALLIAFLFACLTCPVRAVADQAVLKYSETLPAIWGESLHWNSNLYDVQVLKSREQFLPFVDLKGQIQNEDTGLIWDRGEIDIASDGSFSIRVQLIGAATRIKITLINVLGEANTQEFTIEFPNYVSEKLAWKTYRSKSWLFVGGLGVSGNIYRQTGFQNFTQIAFLGKASIVYLLAPRRWDLGANVYGTLLPIASNVRDISMRFFGANLRLGYVLPFMKEPWRLSFMVGWYFATSFVNGDSFGYANLGGPQIYPVLRRAFSNSELSLYVKLSPIVQGTSIVSISSNRELASGLSWTRNVSSKHPWILGLDLANLRLLDSTGNAVDSTSVSVSLGYGFQ